MKKQIIISIFIMALSLLVLAGTIVSQEQKAAGTFFGDTVPRSNYMFVLRIVLSFKKVVRKKR